MLQLGAMPLLPVTFPGRLPKPGCKKDSKVSCDSKFVPRWLLDLVTADFDTRRELRFRGFHPRALFGRWCCSLQLKEIGWGVAGRGLACDATFDFRVAC